LVRGRTTRCSRQRLRLACSCRLQLPSNTLVQGKTFSVIMFIAGLGSKRHAHASASGAAAELERSPSVQGDNMFGQVAQNEISETTSNHRRLASTVFYVLSVFKLLGALFGLRLLFIDSPTPGTGPLGRMLVEQRFSVGLGLLVYYGISFALCIWLARGIKHRKQLARKIAFAYSGLHGSGLVLGFFMPVLFLNGLLGIIAFGALYKGNKHGEFGKPDGEQLVQPDASSGPR